MKPIAKIKAVTFILSIGFQFRASGQEKIEITIQTMILKVVVRPHVSRTSHDSPWVHLPSRRGRIIYQAQGKVSSSTVVGTMHYDIAPIFPVVTSQPGYTL